MNPHQAKLRGYSGWASKAVYSRCGFVDDAERRATGQRKLKAGLKRSEGTSARLCSPKAARSLRKGMASTATGLGLAAPTPLSERYASADNVAGGGSGEGGFGRKSTSSPTRAWRSERRTRSATRWLDSVQARKTCRKTIRTPRLPISIRHLNRAVFYSEFAECL